MLYCIAHEIPIYDAIMFMRIRLHFNYTNFMNAIVQIFY